MASIEVELVASRLAKIAAERNESLGHRESVTTVGVERRPVIVKLIGGPSDGTFTKVVGFGRLCWQKVPGDQKWWAKYVRSAPGEYTFAQDDPDAIIDLVTMAEKINKVGRGRVVGSSGV